jgi:hypothetical protein
MEDHTRSIIEKLKVQIDALEEELVKKKQTVNSLCELEKQPPLYPDAERKSSSVTASFRSDQFFGKPVATSVKEILEQRAALNLGAISLDDLYATMKAGGFEFENKNEPIAKRNLAITLSMNPSFKRTPQGHIGMREWYPGLKDKEDKPKARHGSKK